jgi:hypothetical protein
MQKLICKTCGAENEIRDRYDELTCFNCENILDKSAMSPISDMPHPSESQLDERNDEIYQKQKTRINYSYYFFHGSDCDFDYCD